MELQPRIKTFEMGETFTLETGRNARQATGAVLVSTGDTAVLGTVVGAEAQAGPGLLPLTVNYPEKPTPPVKSRVASSSVKVVRPRKRA